MPASRRGEFDQEMRLFMRAWGGIDGEAAIAEALRERHGDQAEQTKLAQSVLGGWATSNPTAARAWIDAQERGGRTEQLALGLIDGWSVNDFAAAAAYAETRPRSRQRDRFIELLLRRATHSGGVPAAQAWFASIADDEHNQTYKRRAFNGVVQAMLYRDPAEAASWIAANAKEKFVSGAAVRLAADTLALKSPRSAMDWVDSLDGLDDEARRQGVDLVFERWALNDLDGAGKWLGENQGRPEYDVLAAKYAGRIRGDDPEAAKLWVDSISDESMRTEMVALLNTPVRGAAYDHYVKQLQLGSGELPEVPRVFGTQIVDLDSVGGTGDAPFEPESAQSQEPVDLETSTTAVTGLTLSRVAPSLSRKHPPFTGASSCTLCHSR